MIIPQKSGVYLLRNTVNGKIYIGKAKNLQHRICAHKCSEHRKHREYNSRIVQAIRKYGWAAFEVEVLEICEGSNEEEILLLEAGWIQSLKSTDSNIGYNILVFNNDWTGRKHSEATKKKISKMHKGRWAGSKNPFYGKKHTEESRKKIKDHHAECSGSKNGFFGKEHSKESREKMSKTRTGMARPKSRKPVLQFLKSGDFLREWDSAKSAGESLGKRGCDISAVCSGKRGNAFGFLWKYKIIEQKVDKSQSAA